jgi:hypothetical protein
MAARGAKKAGRAQERAAERSEARLEAANRRQEELQEPFRQAGLTAQSELMSLLGLGGDTTAPGYGSMTKQFGMDQFQQDPGYAFRQSESLKAMERSAAARGNLLSGSTLKGVQRFSQDLASQEYQNAFNRYQVERAARLNPLQSLMGSGQSAANVMTSAAGNLGQGLAGAEMAAGQARASGYVGQANALAGALQGIGQAATDFPLYQSYVNYNNAQAAALRDAPGRSRYDASLPRGPGNFGGQGPLKPKNAFGL